MSSREVFISRLEADLEGLKLERRLTEMRHDGEDADSVPADLQRNVDVLQAKERILRERLRRARELPQDGWEREKKALQDAWQELTEMLTGHGASDRD